MQVNVVRGVIKLAISLKAAPNDMLMGLFERTFEYRACRFVGEGLRGVEVGRKGERLSLIHISEPTRRA